jgi:hypothetical protein
MRLLAVCIFVLTLSACVPVPTSPGSDPIIDAAVAQARQTSTVQARVDLEAQATEQAARDANKTENEIRRAMAPVQARQTEAAVELTLAAMRITEAAAQVTQTAAARLAVVEALELQQKQEQVRQEIAAQQRQEANAAAFDSVWRWADPLLRVVLFLAVGLALAAGLYFLPSRWLSHKIRMEKQKKSIVLLPNGNVAYFGPGGLELLTPSGEHSVPAIPNLGSARSSTWGDGSQPETISVTADVLRSKPRQADNTPTGKALALVEAAIRAAGPYTDKIPRWDNLGVTSSQWQYATGILDANGLIEKTPTGTFLREGGGYDSLAKLDQALRNGLILKPMAKASPPLSWAGD